MCGRFAIISPVEELVELFGAEGGVAFSARYNLAPGQSAPVLCNKRPRKLELFRWGLLPVWAQSPTEGLRLINARAETVHEKASFRESFHRRRCIVPADGFYEWTRHKQAMLIRRRDAKPMALAGLWSRWKDLDSFTLLTCPANALMAPIHDRMPVVLDAPAWELWLSPQKADLRELLQPCPAAWLEIRPVSSAVNWVENEGSALWDAPRSLQPSLF